ncbi:hypothetical protein K1W54_00915 [Micromonospora sp. CPCC 205371]|nr:hypothetical protein [Micromonospora sp. CPCC 205371]
MRPRRLLVIGLVSAGLTLVLTATVAVFVWRALGGPDIGAAAEALRAAPAVKLAVVYEAPDGRRVAGNFVVTADRYASGTITDPTAGRAELLAGPDGIAVRGDASFWARRAPRPLKRVTDRWIRPEPDMAYPVDVASALNPSALADLVQSVGRHGSADDTADTVAGQRVVTVTAGDWTALVTADEPRRLMWLGGPIRDRAFSKPVALAPAHRHGSPAAAPGNRRLVGPVARLGWAAAELRGLAPADPIARPPYAAMLPEPATATEAEGVREAVAKVLPDEASSGPPAIANLPAALPVFETKINSTDCTSNVCSWSVTVTNAGTAPGNATVHAYATPGMTGPLSFPLGTLRPGATLTTARMTFPNPAPRAQRGQRTQVFVDYLAWVHSPTLHGNDTDVLRRLGSRGIDPNRDLPQIDPAYQSTVLRATDLMTRNLQRGQRDQLEEAVDAVHDAVRFGLLPELKVIVDSGRLLNPEGLTARLPQADINTLPNATQQPDPGKIGVRREIEQAVEILRQDPRAKVILDGHIEVGGKKYGADVFDTTNKRAYQLKSVSSKRLIANINAAVDQLNGRRNPDGETQVIQDAPPGYTKIAVIYLEPMSLKFHQDTKERLLAFLHGKAELQICKDGRPLIDQLVMVSARGVFQWSKEEFHVFGPPCQ